ncbi:MAG: Asp23/Gls24 family envelope stress response protein [Egibacteraceae bacterium]
MAIPPMTLAAAAAAAAVATKGVTRLDKGPVGTVATYGGGRRVPGVRVVNTDGPQIHVHVVVTLERPIPDVTHDLRDAVLAALEAVGDSGRAVHVYVADVDVQPEADAAAELPPLFEELR